MIGLLALTQYFPTLGSAYAYDDIDYLNETAQAMAGRAGLWETLFRPQGEHLIAGMRLVLYATARLFGPDATPFRLLALGAHCGAALWLALLARRTAGSSAAGLATGLVYVGACGLSSMWIWFPSGASVPFGIFFLTGGLAALAYQDSLGPLRSRLLAGLGVAFCLLCETTLAPLVALPILYDVLLRWRQGRRRPGIFVWSVAGLALAAGVATSLLYTARFGPRMSISVLHGVPRALFLLAVAPFRLLFPGVPIAASSPGLETGALGALLGTVAGGLLLALLVALWRRRPPPLALLAALMVVGPCGVLALVGMGRWRSSYWELYDADRYFFTLAIPIALLAGALAQTAVERLRAWTRRERAFFLLCLAAVAAAELILHRRAMLGRIPFGVYAQHEHRFEQLAKLSRHLTAAARALPPGSPPLTFPDGAFFFPDVHNGLLRVPFLLEIVGHGAGERLLLGDTQVGERDAALLNPVLDAWAQEIGETVPYLRIVDGRLENTHRVTSIDFRLAAFAENVVAGLYDWEQSYRWMGPRSAVRLTIEPHELRLLLQAPISQLRARSPDFPGIAIAVAARDEATNTDIPLGRCMVTADGPQSCTLSVTPFASRLGNGRIAHVSLTADRTWKPSDVFPGSTDARDLSVGVVAVGSGSPQF